MLTCGRLNLPIFLNRIQQEAAISFVSAESKDVRQDPNDAVQRMFESISPRYDLLNHFLSGFMDRSWRRSAVGLLPQAQRVLDLCAGTGDLSVEIHRQLGPDVLLVSADFAGEMLKRSMAKIRAIGGVPRPVQADARCLPWPDSSFDAVTVAFGIRNIYPPEVGLREISRVLRPGGHLVVLEFFGPRRGPVKSFFDFYSRQVLPRVGGVISGDAGAYRYLPESVAAFTGRERFEELLAESQLKCERRVELSGGIATALLAVRQAG